MKIVKSLALGMSSILLLSSCGMHTFEQGDPLLALESTKSASKVACYAAQKAPDYSKLSEMGVLMIELQKSNERMMSMVTGKNNDPCSDGTNLNDVLIADSKNRNDSLKSISGDVKSLGMFGLGIWGVTKVFDSIGGMGGTNNSVTNSGTMSTSRDNLSNDGEGTLSYEAPVTNTTTTTTTDTTDANSGNTTP